MGTITIFDKLNLKEQTKIVVLNTPESFEPELSGLKGVTILRQLQVAGKIDFLIDFVNKKAEITTLVQDITGKITQDPVIWLAYPKGTSKKYKCDFNRDTAWDFLAPIGFEPVRQIAIDEDWSALRFRRREFIKARQ